MTETRKAILAASSVAANTVWFVISLARHRRATRLAADRRRDRPTTDDFLARCEIPDEPLRVEVTLAARRDIAELGTVPADTILPDDSFAHDLVQLPYWDSLEWLGLVLGIGRELDDRVVITEQCFDAAMRVARGQSSDLQVRHVVRAMAPAATDHPKKIRFDDEL